MSMELLDLLQLKAYKWWSPSADVISLQKHTAVIRKKVKIEGISNHPFKHWLNSHFFFFFCWGHTGTVTLGRTRCENTLFHEIVICNSVMVFLAISFKTSWLPEWNTYVSSLAFFHFVLGKSLVDENSCGTQLFLQYTAWPYFSVILEFEKKTL